MQTQLFVAGGTPLPALGLMHQGPAAPLKGWAIQCRLNMLGGGTLTEYSEPRGHGVRVDALGAVGYEVSVNFDALLAKVPHVQPCCLV